MRASLLPWVFCASPQLPTPRFSCQRCYSIMLMMEMVLSSSNRHFHKSSHTLSWSSLDCSLLRVRIRSISQYNCLSTLIDSNSVMVFVTRLLKATVNEDNSKTEMYRYIFLIFTYFDCRSIGSSQPIAQFAQA